MMLRFTSNRAHNLSPYFVITGRDPALPSMVPMQSGLDHNLEDTDPQREAAYAELLAEYALDIHKIVAE